MRKLWLGILATLLLALFVAPAFAWEFSMTGEYEWRQNYLSRMGTNDIFGDATLQDNGINPPGTAIGFAGPSIYGGAPGAYATGNADSATGATNPVWITRGGYSTLGDAAWIGDQRLTFRPVIRVNNAIRISGVYNVGGFRNKFNQVGGGSGIAPYERYYALSSTNHAYDTAGIGSWEQVRATVQLPIGTFSYGIKDFPFGTGLTFANNSRTDSFLFIAPYGPFRFILAGMPSEQITTGWGVTPDTDRKLSYRFGPGFTYDNGPLSFGFLNITQSYHQPRQQNTVFGGTATAATLGLVPGSSSRDVHTYTWGIFAKYNNGRFFANAEYAWINANQYFNYNSNFGAPQLGLSGPRYIEMNKWMAEIGALCGPAKVTLFAAYSSGQVLPGVNVNAAGSTFNPTKWYNIVNANYQILQPYSFLMFPTYGGGNNRFNNDGTGEMGDAFALAARIDYAAAANLNLWGSYIHARRAERHGYWAGSFNGTNPAGAAAATAPQYRIGYTYPLVPTGNGFGASNTGVVNINGADSPANARLFRANYGGGNQNPFIDDDFIGWEAQAGVDWKLLENFSMQMAYSYWQLGPWFDQAYQSFTANSAAGFLGGGILVGRDPIQSVRGSLTIDF